MILAMLLAIFSTKANATTNFGATTSIPAGVANIGTVSGSTVVVVGSAGGYILTQSSSTVVLKSAAFSLSEPGTIVAGVAGKRIKVYALAYTSSGIAEFNFRDGATTNLEGAFAHSPKSGRIESTSPPAFLFATTAGNSLDGAKSGAGSVSGRVSYFEE